MRNKDTNFLLSPDDIAFISDESIFIKKQLVTAKIMELFGSLESEIRTLLPGFKNLLPEQVLVKNGKISKGENYKGLPWMVLDCPATFSKNDVFAYRTLFWWGHPFSFIFHLSGSYFAQHLEALTERLDTLDQDTLICINPNQWEHHHETSNYIPIGEFLNSVTAPAEFFKANGFLKFSGRIPIDQHHKLVSRGVEFLEQLLIRLK